MENFDDENLENLNNDKKKTSYQANRKDKTHNQSKEDIQKGLEQVAETKAPGIGGKIAKAAGNTKLGEKAKDKMANAYNKVPRVMRNSLNNQNPLNKHTRKPITPAIPNAKQGLSSSEIEERKESILNEENNDDKKTNNNDGQNSKTKSGKTDSVSKNKGNSSNTDSSNEIKISGRVSLKVKLAIGAGAVFLGSIIFGVVAIAAIIEPQFELALGANSETDGKDKSEDEFSTDDKEVTNFFDRLKSKKEKLKEENKSIDVTYVVAVYTIINNYNPKFEVDDMTDSVIDEIVTAISSDSGGLLGEEELKTNLLSIFQKHGSSKIKEEDMDSILEEIEEYVDDYIDLITDESNGNSCITAGNFQAAELADLSNEEKLERLGPIAQAVSAKSGVLPSVILGQLVIESGLNFSDLALNDNNLFGIKCSAGWPADRCSSWFTNEQTNTGGVYGTNALFRKYDSIQESFEDHSDFLMGASYINNGLLEANTALGQITAIKAGGYATAVDYVESVMNMIKSYNLEKWDTGISGAISGADNCIEGSGDWTIRTTAPTAADPAFNHYDAYRGQCVWYAKNRAIEVMMELVEKGKMQQSTLDEMKKVINQPLGDAGKMYDGAKATGKFVTTDNINEVRAGQWIVWGQRGAWGHVAFIESVTENEIQVSEGWSTGSGFYSCANDFSCVRFNLKKMSRDEYFNSYAPESLTPGNNYYFIGYVQAVPNGAPFK